jgi:choice-of-anchor C domain-containing protein
MVNGGFESPPAGERWQVFFAGTDIPGWTVESGTVEVVGAYWQAASGGQSLDLSGIFDLAGTIYQDLSTTPGRFYQIRFALAGNPDNAAVKSLKVFWDTNTLATLDFDTTGHSAADMGWVYYEYTVIAAGPVSRLKFQSLTFNALGPVLDDISVTETTAPEGPILGVNLFAGLTIAGPVGATYRIEAASQLNTNEWSALTNIQIATSPFLWIDLQSSNAQKKFYRAIQVP